MSSIFNRLVGQPQVRAFLSAALDCDQISHATLFVGAPGSGKLDAAWLLAQALVCENDGCDACDDCIRAKRRTHPDIHWYEPEGAQQYLVDQIRDLIDDVVLSPIRAKRKVYIINRADLLVAASANALLKTLEEPPAHTAFILIARSEDQVLETIVSRCQVVPFKMLGTQDALATLQAMTGEDFDACKQALAISGSSLTQARAFLQSKDSATLRVAVIRMLASLPTANEIDVLNMAKDLLEQAKLPLSEIEASQEEVYQQNAELLSAKALKRLADQHKRALTSAEQASLKTVLAICRSFLRDLVLINLSQGEMIVNNDFETELMRMAGTQPHLAQDAAGVFAVVDKAEAALDRHAAAQLVFEVLLFALREKLTCQ